MESILLEIEKALNAKLYYLGLVMVLTLPDICTALESPKGETSKKQYMKWYDENVAAKYPNLTANDCYSLRCGVVHQGRCGHPNMQYARVLFTVPNDQKSGFHNNILNGALNLDAMIFCKDMMNRVRHWFSRVQTNQSVKVNLAHLVQFRPQGLSPYMVGMPLIA